MARFWVFWLLPAGLTAQVSVLTGQYDEARSGVNLHETKLNRSNVKSGTFGKRFSRVVDGYIYAQPLYVPNVAIPGLGTHNVVYVATMHNSIYAFDADSPEASAPLWKNSELGAPVPHQPYQSLTINTAGSCKAGGSEPVTAALTSGATLTPEVGILSTPVIDPSTQTLYAVTASLEHGDYCHKLHALDFRTGKERSGSPAIIDGSKPGKDYFSRTGPVTFSSARLLLDNKWAECLQRPALSLVKGKIYVSFAVFHDPPLEPNPWHGWLMAYDAATLDQVAVYNTTSTGGGGGIWQSGRGAAADEQGNLYIATGNGDSDGSVNLSGSILKLSPALSVVAHYSPPDQKTLNAADLDVGTAGPMVLTGKNLVISGSKQGILYLFDTEMRLLDSFAATLPCAAAEWDGCAQLRQYAYWPADEPLLYLWGSPIHQAGSSPQKDVLRAYSLNTGARKFNRMPVSVGTVTSGYPGGIVALSAAGSDRDTGIVWATTSTDSAEGLTVPGVLRAFDASDVSHELWNSEMNPARDQLGGLAKFAAPTVADGQVFVPTFSNQLVVYGLLSAPGTP